jgi:hypothetical protein
MIFPLPIKEVQSRQDYLQIIGGDEVTGLHFEMKLKVPGEFTPGSILKLSMDVIEPNIPQGIVLESESELVFVDAPEPVSQIPLELDGE